MTQIGAGGGGSSTATPPTPVIDMTLSTAISVPTFASGLGRIDSRNSEYGGVPAGGDGHHFYNFTGTRKKLDILAGGTQLQLVAGDNVAPYGAGGFSNSLSNNGWLAMCYSAEAPNASLEDFAFTWPVGSLTDQARQMMGIDAAPTVNQSYTSLDGAIYKVNNIFYSRVYEFGSAVVMPGYSNFYFQATDRAGVMVKAGKLIYIVLRGTTIYEIYTSGRTVTGPVHFKAAFQRGAGWALGASKIDDVQLHNTLTDEMVTAQIGGPSDGVVTTDDAARMATLGLIMSPSATYADLHFNSLDTAIFPAGRQLDYSHTYTVNENQDTQSLTV